MVQIALPLTSLHNLPLGSGYHGRQGRASLRVVRTEGDTLRLTSACDSLEILIEELQWQRDRLTTERDSLSVLSTSIETKASEPRGLPLWAVGAIALLALFVGAYLRGLLRL